MIRISIVSLIVGCVLSFTCCAQKKSMTEVTPSNEWSSVIPDKIKKVEKSESEWKEDLSEMEYYVLRKKGTERSFTGDLLSTKDKGLYVCRGCGLPLFHSGTKFKSGTGWPSFYEPVKEDFIKEATDYDIGYARTEVMCAQCDGHLGHVFPDGPKPTGLRYCINSVSLDFVKSE